MQNGHESDETWMLLPGSLSCPTRTPKEPGLLEAQHASDRKKKVEKHDRNPGNHCSKVLQHYSTIQKRDRSLHDRVG